jgi:predicted hotdog family 3-hydroxylacyl-ACP dehydratase
MPIGKDELCRMIPHSGHMCLLEEVIEWNETEILCTAISHMHIDNPLRRRKRLASVHLLEYGAQAIAVHSGLQARETGMAVSAGYLAALHDVTLNEDYIECIESPLSIHARKIVSMTNGCIYQFTVTGDDSLLASGRVTVMTRRTSSS